MLAAIIININPILVQLGPVAIRWYGLMYVVGIVVGVRAALPFLVSKGITEDQVWNVLGPGIVAGLLGGRLISPAAAASDARLVDVVQQLKFIDRDLRALQTSVGSPGATTIARILENICRNTAATAVSGTACD